MVVPLVVVDIQASGAREGPGDSSEMWGGAHKAIFRRGATFRAILHYSRRTVALASAALSTARWAGKHGARRGPHGARASSRRHGPSRLRLVAPHPLPRSKSAGGRPLR